MNRLPNIHSGEILLHEFLEPLGGSKYRLAKTIGVPAIRFGEICAGKRADTAPIPPCVFPGHWQRPLISGLACRSTTTRKKWKRRLAMLSLKLFLWLLEVPDIFLPKISMEFPEYRIHDRLARSPGRC
jgi:hypothetical protein